MQRDVPQSEVKVADTLLSLLRPGPQYCWDRQGGGPAARQSVSVVVVAQPGGVGTVLSAPRHAVLGVTAPSRGTRVTNEGLRGLISVCELLSHILQLPSEGSSPP